MIWLSEASKCHCNKKCCYVECCGTIAFDWVGKNQEHSVIKVAAHTHADM